MKQFVVLGIVAASLLSVSHVEARTKRKTSHNAKIKTASANSARGAMTKFVALLKKGVASDAELLPFISKNGVRVVSGGVGNKVSYAEAKEEGLHGFFAPGATGMNDIFRDCQWQFKATTPNTFARRRAESDLHQMGE